AGQTLAPACAFCIQSHRPDRSQTVLMGSWNSQRSPALDNVATFGTTAHGHEHEHAHEELGFWRKYVFSQDHKVIGIQYAFTGLLFLLFGFTLMMIMRWNMAYPGAPIPLIGQWLGQARAPGGVMLP